MMMFPLRKCIRFLLPNPRICFAKIHFNVKVSNKETQPYCGSTEHLDPLNLKVEEEKNILDFLNKSTMKELRGVDCFTNEQVTNVLKRRSREGFFSTLAGFPSLLQADENTMRHIYSKMLTYSKAKTNTTTLQKNFFPSLSLEDTKAISSVTGLEICLEAIYFAHLKSNLELVSWNHISYPALDYRRPEPTPVFEMAHSLVRDLPDSDIYLMELHDLTSDRSSIKNMHQRMFIIRLQMSILHLLNKDFSSTGQHRVYFTKKNFVKRTFHLMLGGEGVSGQHLLTSQGNNELLSDLQISSRQRDYFVSLKSDLQKERYTNSFLLPLAFLKQND